jgi:hypothetical protein
MHPDAKNVGAHLDEAPSRVRGLLDRARQLAKIDEAIRTWAQPPLSDGLRVANLRYGVLVLYIDSAVAYTALRYRQQELIDVLQQTLALTVTKIEMKTRPTAQNSK